MLNVRWIHEETVLHFLANEGFTEGVRFLAARGADVNAVNELGDTALLDIPVLGFTRSRTSFSVMARIPTHSRK